MDIPRPPQKKTARNVGIAAGIVALVVITIALARLRPADPTVEIATTIIDSVRRGDIVREVRGPGTLVPEQIRWITADVSARVERLIAQSGEEVASGDVLLEMANPDIEISTMQADQALSAARAGLVALRTSRETNRLSQEAAIASIETGLVTAQIDADVADSLLRVRAMSEMEARGKIAQYGELKKRLDIAQQQLALTVASADSQIAVQTSQVDQFRAMADLQHTRLRSLQMRAPEAGVLQDLTLQPGQWVNAGQTLAKVVQPTKLKAVLRIPESQAKDVLIGQSATIDTRSGVVVGHVSRKDPSAQGGTITVNVALDGALPVGAVPDLSIDGTIQIDHLTNVLYTGRPATGASTGTVGLFRVIENGNAAQRVQVVLGRNSVSTVEIVRGLDVGDKVILSDMSRWDNVDRVRLK